jgi:hypothetical protein
MNLDNLSIRLLNRLTHRPLHPRCALAPFKVFNEDYRHSSEYSDPTYYPFYYYLGRCLYAENLLEIGFESGLEASCFLKGCASVKNYLGFRQQTNTSYWSQRIPISNITNCLKKKPQIWNGNISDPEFLKHFLRRKWDCVLIVRSQNQKTNRRYMELAWGQMPLGGLMVVDYIKDESMRDSYEEFCKISNRQPTVLQTRYGIGLIVR